MGGMYPLMADRDYSIIDTRLRIVEALILNNGMDDLDAGTLQDLMENAEVLTEFVQNGVRNPAPEPPLVLEPEAQPPFRLPLKLEPKLKLPQPKEEF